MRFLKQSTSVDVVIGPVWSTTDGSLKGDLAYNASGINCDLYKVGTKADVTLANSAGDGYFRAGSGEAQYILTLSTGHTDTLGMLRLTLSATGYYMKPEDFMVVPANVWDSMFGADYLKTEVVEISGDSTAADNLEADYDGTGYAKTNSTTKLHADYDAAKTAASQSSVNTIDDFLDTEVAAILADTNELQTDLTNGGRLDLLIDAIKAKTDNLPDSPAAVGSAMTLTSAYDAAKTAAAAGAKMDLVDAPNATAVTAIQNGLATAAALDVVDNFVDTEVGAIKAVTDKLDTALELDSTVYRFTTNALEQAPTGGSAPTAAAIADAVLDEAMSGHTTAGTLGKAVADILADTNELQTNQGNWATATGFSTHSAADVKTAIEAAGSHLALIKAKTDNLPSDPADQSAVEAAITAAHSTTDGKIDAVDDYVDTEVGAIKAVTDKLDTALELDSTVYRFTTNALEQAPTGGSAPTAAAIADAVWDEALAGHADVGSAGAGLTAAGSAGDPWATALPGSYGAGTAGKLIGDNINAPIATVDTVVDAIKAKTDNLPASPAAVGSQMDLVDAPNATAVTAIQSGLSTLSAGDVADAVWDESTASHTSSGTFGRLLNLLRRLLFNRQVDSGNSVENFDDDGETSLGTASWSEPTGTRGKHTVTW